MCDYWQQIHVLTLHFTVSQLAVNYSAKNGTGVKPFKFRIALSRLAWNILI